MGGSSLYLFYENHGKNTCRCTHHNKQPISTWGMTSTIPIAIAFTWCVALKKVPGTFKKKSAAPWYTLCTAPVNTRKYSNLKTLSFSTRLHKKIHVIKVMDRKDNGEKSFIIILFLFQLVKLTTNFPSQHLTQTYYKLTTNLLQIQNLLQCTAIFFVVSKHKVTTMSITI